MNKFTKAVKLWQNWLLMKIPSSDYWVVKKAFYWYIDYKEKDIKITVSKWFLTDFWSVPRILWSIFDKTKYISYILHDKMYSKEFWIALTRKQADQILLEALHVEGASFIERTLIYIWVRIWWGLFFKKK